MRARVLGPAAKPEATGEVVLIAPDCATATKLRHRWSELRFLVANERLPFADGALDEIVDERPARPAGVEEDARVVRAGGRVVLVTGTDGTSGLAARLGGLWKKHRRPVAPTDASAWLLGAGCNEIEQRTTKDGAVLTEARRSDP